MAEHNRMDRTHGDYERRREDEFQHWAQDRYRRPVDYRHSDYRNRANMSSYSPNPADRTYEQHDRYRGTTSHDPEYQRFERGYDDSRDRRTLNEDRDDRNFVERSIDEVRSWFGGDEADRGRERDSREEREGYERRGYNNGEYGRSRREEGWSGQRGMASDIDRDYSRWSQRDRDQDDRPSFRYSNDYGGPRNTDFYRDYPTHHTGRSPFNSEDDHTRREYGRYFDEESRHPRTFGGRDYERNYPTRADREHTHDLSEGWQSADSYRGYRSLNNTGRTGIDRDNVLGRDRDERPNTRDGNYSRGDFSPTLNAGGQDFNTRHYPDRDRLGTRVNDYGQRGYSQGYGRTGYSLGSYDTTQQDTSRLEANRDDFFGKGPKNYRQDTDRVHVDVCEALTRHPEIDASDIDVRAENGEVTLTGSVQSRIQKRLAEDVIENVPGVRDVHNRLQVSGERSSSSQSSPGSNTELPTRAGNSSRTDLAHDTSRATQSSANGGENSKGSASANGGAANAGSSAAANGSHNANSTGRSKSKG